MKSLAVTSTAVLLLTLGAKVTGGGFEMHLGTTSLGDYCGVSLEGAGGIDGLGGGDPIPMGEWAFPSCGTPIGQRQCITSPFYMAWFAHFTFEHFYDKACCPGNQVRNAYITVTDGTPSSVVIYRCEDYAG